MNNLKVSEIMFLLIIITSKVSAQSQESIIPPSPTASSLLKIMQNDVSYYEGKPQIEIPIFNYEQSTLSLKVSLSYTGSSGIKVQEISGPVGLGWALNAGGAITRVVRGRPDEEPSDGYCMNGISNKLKDPITSTSFKNAITDLSGPDMEPDVFSCTTGGRIIMDSDKKAYFINSGKNVIKQNGVFSGDKSWIIIDGEGTKYIYGGNNSAQEVNLDLNGFHISSWYLTDIIAEDGSKISFEYEKGAETIYQYYTHIKTTGTGEIYESKEYRAGLQNEVYLKKIKINTGSINFGYGMRLDYPKSKSLESIKILDNNNHSISLYRLNKGYFKNAANNTRLKFLELEQLNSTQKKSVSVARFNYYEEHNLPERSSEKIDFYGYYNNNTSGSRFKSDGADKSSDFLRNKANVLESIIWPTNGKTEYVYELNTFKKGNSIHSGGGMRISKIKTINGNETLTTSYFYLNENNETSGILCNDFDLNTGYTFSAQHNIDNQLVTLITEYELPISKMLDYSNVKVGYERVIVLHPDQSKEIFSYTSYNDYQDILNGVFYNANNSSYNGQSLFNWSNIQNVFTSKTSADWKRGLLKEMKMLDNNGGLVKKISNTYSHIEGQKIFGSQKVSYYLNGYDNFFYASLYHENVCFSQLEKQVEIEYGFDNLPRDSKTSFFEYLSSHPSIVKKKTSNLSNGKLLVITYNFPNQYVSQNGVLSKMVDKNIMVPIETVTEIKKGSESKVVEGKLNIYKEFTFQNGTKILPSKTLQLKIDKPISDYSYLISENNYDSRYYPEIIFDSYDKNGILQEYHKTDGLPISLIREHNSQYIIASVTNANNDEVAYSGFEEDYTLENSKWVNIGLSDFVLYSDQNTPSGNACMGMHDNENGSIRSSALNIVASKTYILSFWCKGGGVVITNPSAIIDYNKAIDTKGQWVLREMSFRGVSGDLELSLENLNSHVYIDELRLFPATSLMTTYIYKPLIGMSIKTDPNNEKELYHYDDFNRLSLIQDNAANILKKIEYYYAFNKGWESTGETDCVQNANSENTGEQRIKEIDKDETSPTYNQTRWRSIGYTSSCLKLVYAKLFTENQQFESTDPYDGEGYARDIIVRFFSDAACTIPVNVRPINVSYGVSTLGSSPGFALEPNGETKLVNGNSFLLKDRSLYLAYGPSFSVQYYYFLLPGDFYIVVP